MAAACEGAEWDAERDANRWLGVELAVRSVEGETSSSQTSMVDFLCV
jgi:hypothetical protein